MNSKPHPFQKRIKYQGDITILLKQVAKDYNLGKYKSHEVVGVGYEDFNVILETDKYKYFVKFLADFRDEKECKRYVEIINTALKNNIRHPKLYKSNQGGLYEIDTKDGMIRLIVLEYIDGKTFFDLKQKPTEAEQNILIEQAALINKIDFKPTFLYDSWAVVNFLKEYKEIKDKLKQSDIDLIQPIVDQFSQIDIESLPHCFVHGDIIDTNVMKSKDGDLLILDFAVSNYYPRIQELAVMLCDILFDPKKSEGFKEVYKRTLSVYQKYIKLTYLELETLPLYIKAAHAMHIIGAAKSAIDMGESEENDHWMEAGRQGINKINLTK